MQDQAIRNVSRHVTQFSSGWYVRMMSNGKKKAKYFNDKTYGDSKKSLHAAVSYRDRLRKTAKDGRERA